MSNKKTDEQKKAEKEAKAQAKAEAKAKAAAEKKKAEQTKEPGEVLATDKPASINAKDKLYKLKLKTRHPKNAFRIGQHLITPHAQDFKLSADEEKELFTPGPQAFIEIL